MPEIYEIEMYSRPFWEIKRRLAYHCRDIEGRRCRKLKFDAEGVIEADGTEDLPFILPFTMTDTETIGAGAVPQGFASGSSNVLITQTFEFMIASRREFGLVRSDPTTEAEKKRGILEWIAAIRDAIETDTDGSVDPLLKESVYKPIEFNVTDLSVTELSWTAIMRVTCSIPHWTRRGRTETNV
jgi:hypothetical protein